MQHNYCTPGASACEGNLAACPRCGDIVCDQHAVDSLCLACQDDAAELGCEPGGLAAYDSKEEVA